jgi:hypothetical protein
MPKMDENVSKFLGEHLEKQVKDKIQDMTFSDLRKLADSFDKLPPRKRKQSRAMCCCSMCCCAAAVTSANNADQVK